MALASSGPALTGVLATVAILAAFGHASAQDEQADDTERARALFEEGVILFNRGAFDEACPKLEASLELFAGVGNRGKLAECYEKLGRTATAMRLYREVALVAGRSGDERRQQIATERADALEARVARLTIIPGPSFALPGFKIVSDGRELASRHYKVKRAVDPGTHIVSVRADGYEKYTATVTLAEGGSAILTIRSLTAVATEPAAPPEPPSSSVPGMVTTATGLAIAIGGAMTFGLLARSRWQGALNGGCDLTRRLCSDYGAQELAVAAKRDAFIADLSIGVGVATTLVGGYLWWRAIRSQRRSETVTAVPTVGRGTAGLLLTGRF